MRPLPPAAIALALLSLPGPGRATECDTPASDWLFCEDFEQGALGVTDWLAQSPFVGCIGCADPGRLQLTSEPGQVLDGQWALDMPAAASSNYLGAELKYRSCAGEMRSGCNPLTGHDQLYFRAWVQLAPEHRYVHHFMSLGGTRPDAYWEGDGNAGCRPNGVRAASTTVDFKWSEARGEHELFFYTYFPEMNCDSGVTNSSCVSRQPAICEECAGKDMPCSDGPECCWGNHFNTEPKPVLPRGEWVCLEMMMRLNTPQQADGEMAYWVNDVLGHRQTGMHWRDVPELQLNKVGAQHFIDHGDTSQSNRIQWDNLVASTSRIGCGQVSLPDGGTDASSGGDAATANDSATNSDAATANDSATNSDAATSSDAATGSDAATSGCVPICFDESTLHSCTADGQVVVLNCPAGRRCVAAHCENDTSAGADAGAGSGTSSSGCACGGASAVPASGVLLLGVLLLARRRRPARRGATCP